MRNLDVFECGKQLSHAAREQGLQWVSGVEVSTVWQGTSIHILGLRIDPEHAGLRAALSSTREMRKVRAPSIVTLATSLSDKGAP